MYQVVQSFPDAWAIVLMEISSTMPCCSQGEGQQGSRDANSGYYPKGKRTEPSGGASTTFLANKALELALRSMFRKKIGGCLSTRPRKTSKMLLEPTFTVNGSTLQKKHLCAPVVCKGTLVTTQTPKPPGPFWQATMSTLQTLTKQQERSLRSAPGSGL